MYLNLQYATFAEIQNLDHKLMMCHKANTIGTQKIITKIEGTKLLSLQNLSLQTATLGDLKPPLFN